MTRFETLSAVVAIGGFLAVSPANAQTPAPPPAAPHDHQAAPASPGAGVRAAEPRHDMTAMHEKMMADMAAADADLDALVARMNGASGMARVDALVEVVTTMVNRQKAMHAHMAQMHDHMMQMDPTARPMGGPMMGQ